MDHRTTGPRDHWMHKSTTHHHAPVKFFNKTFLGVILSTSQEEMKQTGTQWREWELVKWSLTSFYQMRKFSVEMFGASHGGRWRRRRTTGAWLTGVTTLHGGEETEGQCHDSQTITHCTARSKQTVLCQETPLDLFVKTNSYRATLSDSLPL